MDITYFTRLLLSHVAYLEGGSELEGSELADLLPALVNLEVREGGPYAVVGTAPDLGLNLAIARFLAALGVTLPNVEEFIQLSIPSSRSIILSEHEQAELIYWYENRAVRPVLPSVNWMEEHALATFWEIATEKLVVLTPETRTLARRALAQTVKGNPDRQMTLMPFLTQEALGTEVCTEEEIGELGFLSACFWTSFIIYDDFWDEDEDANPQLLPLANWFARQFTDYFVSLSPEFREFFMRIMDKLDLANSWEMLRCRMKVQDEKVLIPRVLPEYDAYQVKFYPAAGHVCGPLAVLVQSGYDLSTSESRSLMAYFENYLIAMQLNDDLHDWKEDIERGHISTAVAALLVAWKESHVDSEEIDLAEDEEELQQLFWVKVLPSMCTEIMDKCKRSREALKHVTALQEPAFLERFIIQNERAAQEALSEWKQSNSFLQAVKIPEKL